MEQEKKISGLLEELVSVGNNLLKEMDWEDVKKHKEFIAVKQEIAKAKELEE